MRFPALKVVQKANKNVQKNPSKENCHKTFKKNVIETVKKQLYIQENYKYYGKTS